MKEKKATEALIGYVKIDHTYIQAITISDDKGVFNLKLDTQCDDGGGGSNSSSISMFTGDKEDKKKLFDFFTTLANKFKN